MARSRTGLPDLNFVRNEIPIVDVAHALGLKIMGRSLGHCWRVDHHKNGDRTPSISFHKNRAKCFVCDPRSLSTLDLVILHENCDLREATKWFRARWDVPEIPPNTKLRRPEHWKPGRAGVGDAFWDSLVRTGFWAWLDDAGRAVLVALRAFIDPHTNEASISYRGLCRYAGKASRTTIARAVSRFERIGLLKVTRAREGATRKVSTYRVTPDDEQFKQLLDKIHERLVAERDLEKMSLAASPYKGNSNLAGLPRSNLMSSVVDREESPRFAVLNRSSEFSPEESERSTTVNRSNGDGHPVRLQYFRSLTPEAIDQIGHPYPGNEHLANQPPHYPQEIAVLVKAGPPADVAP